jgi:hypothetical protein
MSYDREHALRPGSATHPAASAAVARPGKQTRVEGLRFPGPVQRKPGPIQRQGGDDKPPAPPVVYQYGAGTHDGRFNDCGPACVWMVLRMLGPDCEAQLEQWIVAHRPRTEG